MPMELVRREARLAMQHRVRASQSYDAESRTVEIVAATDAPILQPGWRIGIEGNYYEILDMDPGSVDLSSVADGNCPLLTDHNRWSMAARLGGVTAARVEGGQLHVIGAFGESDVARSVEAEMTSAAPPAVSSGYAVEQLRFERFEGDVPVYRATRWKLREVSFVPIAADPNAGVRSDNGSHPCIIMETRAMPPEQTPAAGTPAETTAAQPPAAQPTPATPADGQRSDPAPAAPAAAPSTAAATAPTLSPTDILQLQDQARSLGVETQARAAFEADGATRASISDAILAAAATRQAGGASPSPIPAGSGARAGDDERTHRRDGIRGAILAGLRGAAGGDAGDIPDVAQPYMRHSITELAAISMGDREMPRTAADRVEVLSRAFHTTSDFPMLLGGAMNTRLEENYVLAEPVYRRIARQMTFADFRPHTVLRAGDFPQLQKVGEAGEIKFGTFGEKQETIAVVPYGVQFGLSRQLLVNDHLGAIDQILASQGQSVALFEELTFFAMKGTIGPVLDEDGKAVFHADHNNLAGSGGAISATTLAAGRAAMRKQKNLSGAIMGVAPKILLVSPDKELEAEQVIAPIVPGQTTAVNPFSGKLEVVVAPQLAGNAWELYADPRFGTNWTWGLLDGFKAPRLKVEEVFGQQGVKVSLEHDFGCGATDFRFGFRNPGA